MAYVESHGAGIHTERYVMQWGLRPAIFPSTKAADITRDLRRRIRSRFRSSHTVLFEVPVEGMAYRAELGREVEVRRSIDAVAVGGSNRHGFLVHGFEIKTGSDDLMKELHNDCAKSAPARRVCDRWWLVVPSLDLFTWRWEHPPGWGLLVATSRHLEEFIKPAPLDAERDPRFIQHLMQRALGSHGACKGLARVNGYHAGYERGIEEGKRLGRAEAAMGRRRAASKAS